MARAGPSGGAGVPERPPVVALLLTRLTSDVRAAVPIGERAGVDDVRQLARVARRRLDGLGNWRKPIWDPRSTAPAAQQGVAVDIPPEVGLPLCGGRGVPPFGGGRVLPPPHGRHPRDNVGRRHRRRRALGGCGRGFGSGGGGCADVCGLDADLAAAPVKVVLNGPCGGFGARRTRRLPSGRPRPPGRAGTRQAGLRRRRPRCDDGACQDAGAERCDALDGAPAEHLGVAARRDLDEVARRGLAAASPSSRVVGAASVASVTSPASRVGPAAAALAARGVPSSGCLAHWIGAGRQ